MKFLAVVLALAAVVAVGCVSKVTGGRRAGVPFVKDQVEGRYERSVDMVFAAAKEVVSSQGTLSNESILHSETNMVKTLIGKVEKRSIYIKVQPIDATVTSVYVQARTSAGASDMDMAHQIEKLIALKMVQ